MPHLSRLIAAICAITVILASPPTDAGIGDKDLPLLNGKKTKLLYTVVGVTDRSDLATAFHCTSTERTGGNDIHVGIEVFDQGGNVSNDVSADEGEFIVAPGRTRTASTRATLAFDDNNIINAVDIDQGSARIFATSKNLLCSAMILDAVNVLPTSMVMLPVFKATKQGGM